ncbi:VPLPA-CTERM sorting domain-containing protein [Roseibacterium sp. SDUM158017]|uniref:VPLPA-CTERM sorting domain-containing protein n=1 Tax=Roseicyclus salinarum TaxID=3036773 RepID=UPI0024150524|nr:VPLPA-CTERM sorting domain-containing protein [Roseibacterium sp. SDUM158017]MDG4647260.1 VPLPA-CTERM sorting domain-containing protein [Roseibacterium sp. SDUM158017]
MSTGKIIALAAAVASLAAPASAVVLKYEAVVQELNRSGVSGLVLFDHDTRAQTLRVRADIMGLVPLMPHVNHIHGRFNEDGTPRNSVTPTMAEDDIANGSNGDGFVDVFEGFDQYGDVLLSLEENPTPASNHNGPFADDAGRVTYDITYDLMSDTPENGPIFSTVSGRDYTARDLFPLDLREYVIHGGFVDANFDNGLQRGPGYVATLPVGAAEISAVPLPASAVLLLGGLGGLALMRRRKG